MPHLWPTPAPVNPGTGNRPSTAAEPTTEMLALTDAITAWYRAPVVLAAGTGRRQRECFGLTKDRVDFPWRTVTVDRQLILQKGQGPALGPPKTDASYGKVPPCRRSSWKPSRPT